VPVVTGFTDSGLEGVSFVPFGVSLDFVPRIIERDRIRLTLAAEVSDRNTQLGANIGGDEEAGGTQVSGLDTRNFTTTVELRDGQTLAVAGLIQQKMSVESERVPFWGNLPIVGRLGGAVDSITSGETELVILVTPELVHPIEQCEQPALPGSDVFEPGDIEFYLLGNLESRRSYDYRASVRTDHHRKVRYETCNDVFIIGQTGYSNCPNVPLSSFPGYGPLTAD
jgi:pilus assembly protein CpaC